MARFADALASHPAPTVLGDVALRYEPSMLIGETPKGRRTWRPTAAWLLGVSLLLFALGALLLTLSDVSVGALVVGGGVVIGFAVWLERSEKRQRRFVANFATVSLRLDFSSAIAGYPLTLVVPFDDVTALELVPQADGALCLLVDFHLGGRTLREVLVAFIPEAQQVEAERLERVLRGAFGLGEVPPDSPALPRDASTFEPSSTR